MRKLKEFLNLDSLIKYVQDELNDVNKDEVSDFLVDKLASHVESDVYSYPTSGIYQRTGKLKKDFDIHMDENEGILSVDSARYDEDNPSKYVAEIVETGKNYSWNTYLRGVARPFVENTHDELEQTDELENYIRSALKFRGIDVE